MRFKARSRPALAMVLLALGFAAPRLHAQPEAPAGPYRSSPGKNSPNSAQAQGQHYLVLVSLDGFRWDYAQRDGAEHLMALGKQGTSVPEGMLPSYPTLGLPNRFTIVTGLYPGHHGLVSDNFYDPDRKARFSAADVKDSADGSWYSGVPLWSLAEGQGMRTAVIGWPGSEAVIAGFHPSYSFGSCNHADTKKCVEQVLHWLRLPAAERPHFIAVDFSGLEVEARRFGPDAPEVKAAVLHADELVGRLKAGLDDLGLPVNLVVVSDCGMAKTEGGWITLDQFTSLAGFETDGGLLYGQTEQERERVYRQLNHVSSLFVVYRRKDLPPELHMSLNPRAGDPVVIPTGPYAIRARAPSVGQPDHSPPAGVDGLDPKQPQMKGVFFAAGPDIAPGKTVAPFENVNLYPWMAHLLGLKPPKSDGSLNILAGTLHDDGTQPQDQSNP
jgi:predicted AlkP superfamily pyrophosphatase or phosphodiesterase